MFNKTQSPGFKWRPRLKIYTDGANNTFDADTFKAISYKWWTYCKKVNGKIVFNEFPYSSTTSGHQSSMRTLLKKLRKRVDIHVYTRASLDDGHSVGLDTMYEALFKLEIESKRARTPNVYVSELNKCFKTRSKAIDALKANIKALRSIGAKPSAPLKQIKEAVINADAQRLAHAREKARQMREAKKLLVVEMKRLEPVDLSVYSKMNDFDNIAIINRNNGFE